MSYLKALGTICYAAKTLFSDKEKDDEVERLAALKEQAVANINKRKKIAEAEDEFCEQLKREYGDGWKEVYSEMMSLEQTPSTPRKSIDVYHHRS